MKIHTDAVWKDVEKHTAFLKANGNLRQLVSHLCLVLLHSHIVSLLSSTQGCNELYSLHFVTLYLVERSQALIVASSQMPSGSACQQSPTHES